MSVPVVNEVANDFRDLLVNPAAGMVFEIACLTEQVQHYTTLGVKCPTGY